MAGRRICEAKMDSHATVIPTDPHPDLRQRADDLAERRARKRAGSVQTLGWDVSLRARCTDSISRPDGPQLHVVLVAELAGHRRLETTRRYSLPSDADRQLAMDGLEIED